MTHEDGPPVFSARSVRLSDAGHREAGATTSEGTGGPPFGSRSHPRQGRQRGLTMPRIAGATLPTRHGTIAILMGHDQRSLV